MLLCIVFGRSTKALLSSSTAPRNRNYYLCNQTAWLGHSHTEQLALQEFYFFDPSVWPTNVFMNCPTPLKSSITRTAFSGNNLQKNEECSYCTNSSAYTVWLLRSPKICVDCRELTLTGAAASYTRLVWPLLAHCVALLARLCGLLALAPALAAI